MRPVFLFLLFAMALSTLAQESSTSEQLKEKFFIILEHQVTAMMDETANQAAQGPSAEEISSVIASVMKEAQMSYGPLLTLPENEANRLLTTGPDDKANMEAMQRNIELWKKVQRPMPVLYKRMQDEVMTGRIKGGLELELTRRISEFHLKQLGLLNP